MIFADDETLLDACRREIDDLHLFFEAWLAGNLPATDEILSRLETALEPGFTLIGPDGRARDRATVVDWIRDSHSRRPDLQIWIENATLRWSDDSTTLVTYEEWQREGGSVNARQSTALFLNRSAAPNGLTWLHVHESWLEEPV